MAPMYLVTLEFCHVKATMTEHETICDYGDVCFAKRHRNGAWLNLDTPTIFECEMRAVRSRDNTSLHLQGNRYCL